MPPAVRTLLLSYAWVVALAASLLACGMTAPGPGDSHDLANLSEKDGELPKSPFDFGAEREALEEGGGEEDPEATPSAEFHHLPPPDEIDPTPTADEPWLRLCRDELFRPPIA